MNAREMAVLPIPSETKKPKQRHLTYNPDFDSEKYAALQLLKDESHEAYAAKKEQLDGGTIFNLQTMLGERYHAALSNRQDRIINGKIYSAYSDEPMQVMFERGRDHRYENSSPHDRLREAAEIEGFVKMQTVLADEATPVGTMMVSISPPGGKDSEYEHNFYDIFTLKEENGVRFIDATRYSSALKPYEYVEAVSAMQPGYFASKEQEDIPYDVYFLTNPLRIDPESSTIKTAEDLHARLHKDHETISREALAYVFAGCESLYLTYIGILTDSPWNVHKRNLTLNAILNKADHLVTKYEEKELFRSGKWEVIYRRDERDDGEEKGIDYWGRQQVRASTTGCGYLGGFAVGGREVGGGGVFALGRSMGPFSVSEFGVSADKYGKMTFHCPHCQYENKRPYNQLIKYCQNSSCGKDVSC